jgi:hypothetical protein
MFPCDIFTHVLVGIYHFRMGKREKYKQAFGRTK